MSIWSKLTEAAKDAAADLATLDVVTLTGSIDIHSHATDAGVDLKAMYTAFKTKVADTNSDIKVVAFSHIDFDADSVNFASSDLQEEQKALLIAHAENVKAAQETRAGMIRTVKAFFST